ncbi:MAG: hypothetical protein WBA46_05810 [Thermomicrobiales bacterium]
MSLERRVNILEKVLAPWDPNDMRTWFAPRRYEAMRKHLASLAPVSLPEEDFARFEAIIGNVWARMQANHPGVPEEELMYQFTYHESPTDLMTPLEIAEAKALLGIDHAARESA